MTPSQTSSTEELQSLPPRHYPEWDYTSQTFRPDWVSLYERLHPSGNAADIDGLLAKHSALSKRLKRLLDLLKPQDKVRVRYQEDGSELDLDVAIRSLIDLRAGSQPDPRINMSHTTDGRSIAVTLLLDLSQSLNEKARGSEQTVLQLSQEAVSLLAWAVQQLGDPLAIAGFHSNTRHDVRYCTSRALANAGATMSRPAWPPCRRVTAPAWGQPCAMRRTPCAHSRLTKNCCWC